MGGIPQLHPLDPYPEVPATTMADQAGMEVLTTEDGISFARTSAGSWIRVADADFGEGCDSLTVQVCTEEACRMWILTEGLRGPTAAEIVLREGDTAITVPISISGRKDLIFAFDGTVDFYTWQFSGFSQ